MQGSLCDLQGWKINSWSSGVNKPELPLELLNGSIAHIEGLKAKTELLLGKKNLLSDAIITMDLCGHSYDYSELVVMRNSLLNTAGNVTNTIGKAWEGPEDAIQSIRLAHEKMKQLDEEKTKLLKEHQVKYGRDLWDEVMRSDDDTPLPRPFLYDEYLAKKDITPVWAEKLWPHIQRFPLKRVKSPETVAAIKIIDL